jgi:Spy/CpxP family protein refolding chaperone
MKNKVLFLSVFALALLFTSQLKAQQASYKNHEKSGFMEDLTEVQKLSIDAIKIENHKKTTLYKADLKIKQAELNKLEVSEEPSISEIHSKIDEIAVLKADIQKEKVSTHILIRNELTPEQRVKFDMHKSAKGNMKMDNVKDQHRNSNSENRMMNSDCKHK